MGERYKPCGYGTGTYEEKRSRFIGELWPAADEEAARARITTVKKHYPDARHHCWAYILPDGAYRWSDDGEPGGTAGAPMLEVLRGADFPDSLAHVSAVLETRALKMLGRVADSGARWRRYLESQKGAERKWMV